jgi:hypothetical protein
MPDCDYCGESFGDEQSYLEHLADAHEGELGTIDQRRVAENVDTSDETGLPIGPLVLGFVLAVAVALVAYVTLFLGSGSAGNSGTVNGFEIDQMPGQVSQSEHGHGLINVTIAGNELDFSQPRFQVGQTGARAFHFEGGNGRIWHKHAGGVTLEYAMATLGIGVTGDTVTYEGTTYRESDAGTNVTVTVNGQSVDPSSYLLSGASDESPEQGDFIRIIVTTDANG